LEQFNLRTVLIKNRATGRFFILLVEKGKEHLFDAYCEQENLMIITWMDNSEVLQNVEEKLLG